MTTNGIIRNIESEGYQIHGRCRGKSGYCHIIASKRECCDYGDKQCRSFIAVKIEKPDLDIISFEYLVSRKALACGLVNRITKDTEEFLLQAGFHKFRELLREDDTPGRKEKYMLRKESPDDEFVMYDQKELVSEEKRIKIEILSMLNTNRLRGVKRTTKQDIENTVCTIPSILDTVLDFLEQKSFIKGAYGSLIKITADGITELNKISVIEKPEVKTLTDNIEDTHFDVFISHASEDKELFVELLAKTMQEKGIKVWYDDFSLKWGDSLRRSIERGLKNSQYGIVVLSHNFFKKEWPQKELDALLSLMSANEQKLLPIWHNLTAEDVKKYSPILSGIVAVKSSDGIDKIIKEMQHLLSK